MATNQFVARNGIISLNDEQITGSLYVSGTLVSITGSLTVLGGITGSHLGTSSYTISSSYALSSSYAVSSSNTISSSYTLSSSYAVSSSNAISSSYTLSSSYAVSSSTAITASYTIGALTATGSFTGSFTGSLLGTASQAVSSSFALTASYVANASSFPFTGSAIISGSLIVTGSVASSGGFTGSLFGTSSQAVSASYAGTASLLLGSVVSASYALTASYALNGGTGGAGFPYTGSAVITGSLVVYSPSIILQSSQSGILFNQTISQSATPASSSVVYGVNITPTFLNTSGSQTQTALRVQAIFTGSASGSNTTNRIVDFGAQSAGSQLTVTDVTSGSIYVVSDVSGLPIIEATSNWTVNMYNYPNIVLQKTGSVVKISGSLIVTGSIAGGGVTPTLLTGSGLGTAKASGSIIGSNNGGVLTLQAGTGTTANAGLARVTYTTAFPNGSSIVLFPLNVSGSNTPTGSIFASGSTTSFVLSSSVLALQASVTSSWNYIVMGF